MKFDTSLGSGTLFSVVLPSRRVLDMANEFGNFLQALRQQRRLSTSQLAQKAGIRRATLSEWQSGKRRPRLPELEAVLKGLGSSEAQERQARELLSAPGALLHRRQEGKDSDPEIFALAGNAPHGGDLLRALRLRKGWTQAEIAARLRVTQATVARWEAAECWPSDEDLHRLCFLTDAHEQELIALTTGRFHLSDGRTLSCADDVGRELKAIVAVAGSAIDYPLTELRFLTLATQAWQLVRDGKARLDVVAQVHAEYANHLYMQHRLAEAGARAAQALDIYHSLRVQDKYTERATIRSAQVLSYRVRNNGLGEAIGILEDLLKGTLEQENAEWARSNLGLLKAREGHAEQAVALGRKTVQIAQQVAHFDPRYRPADLARILLLVRRPEEAQDVLRHADIGTFPFHPYASLLQAEIHFTLGKHEAALELLGNIQDGLEHRRSVDESEVRYYSHEVELRMERWEAVSH
jgi:transcriptional regulator with XRE-family HTH domain